jgi:hypothetical protein
MNYIDKYVEFRNHFLEKGTVGVASTGRPMPKMVLTDGLFMFGYWLSKMVDYMAAPSTGLQYRLATYDTGMLEAGSVTAKVYLAWPPDTLTNPEVRLSTPDGYPIVIDDGEKLTGGSENPARAASAIRMVRGYQKCVEAMQISPAAFTIEGYWNLDRAERLFSGCYQIAAELNALGMEAPPGENLKILIRDTREVVVDVAEGIGAGAAWGLETAGRGLGSGVGGFLDEIGLAGLALVGGAILFAKYT